MHADRQLINAMCELSDNILAGNIKLTPEQYKCLEKHKKLLRKIVLRTTLSKKRKYLSQSGGFLQYIIPAAISAISTIFSSVINKDD
jgi:hypothetical protein